MGASGGEVEGGDAGTRGDVVRVDRWFGRGRCLAFDEATGDSFLVARTAPGERVAVTRYVRAGRRYPVAAQILTPSPERIVPMCQHYDRCTGCDLLHVTPEAEGSLKRLVVGEVLSRVGGAAVAAWRGGDPAAPDKPAGAPGAPHVELVGACERGGHRVRARYDVCPATRRLGMRGFDGGIVPIADCPASAPAVRAAMSVLDGWLAEGGEATSVEVLTSAHGVGVIVDGDAAGVAAALPGACVAVRDGHEVRVVAGSWPRAAAIGDVALEDAPGAWTHPCPDAAASLYAWVEALGAHAGADVLDLTCGAGGLTLLLARRARHVVASDASWAAVQSATRAAARAGAANVTFAGGKAATVGSRRAAAGERYGLVVLNPMREPLGEVAMRAVDILATSAILYLAPAPVSGARDLAALSDRWALERVTAVSLHPGTASVMMAALLRRRDGVITAGV